MTDNLFTRDDPWPHQREGVQQAIDALSNGAESVCLTAPTGSGKTQCQIALAKWGVEEERDAAFLDGVRSTVHVALQQMNWESDE